MLNPIIFGLLNDGEFESPSLDFAHENIAVQVANFHQSLPHYEPTPLVRLNSLAKQLGLATLLVKDESQRFDLNAFKVLGASWAMAKYLGAELGLTTLLFNLILAEKARYKDITFVTATDGNHGRAVAWAAEKFGCKSVVYMPKGSSPARLKAIQGYGALASITDLNYDDTVRYAKQKAQDNDWVLLQDTSWPGYDDVPLNIMQGYFSLMTEYCLQETQIWPTHVFIQAGVGSLPAAILAYLSTSLCISTRGPKPIFVVVEPLGAPCLYDSMSLYHGEPCRVEGDLPTIMAGLACGEPSHLALEILRANAAAFIKCSDDVARRGMKVLGNPMPQDQRIISGESGAVTLGVVYELYSNPEFAELKADLKLTSSSKVLLFSTEGNTDPDVYREIVWS